MMVRNEATYFGYANWPEIPQIGLAIPQTGPDYNRARRRT
jgi:hypothetical protein